MKKIKLVVAALASVLLISSLTGCGGGSKPEESVDFSFSAKLDSGVKSIKVGQTAEIEITESESSDLEIDPETGEPVTPTHTYTFESSAPECISVDADGKLTANAVGEATISITEAPEGVKRNLVINTYDKEPANGIVTYKTSPAATREEILGKLEKYALDNNLAGISLFENGGYTMYNSRVQKGTENYITGYGFGIAREGNIIEDLPSETKAEWKRYYHTATANDEKDINILDSDGSAISDLYSFISSSYFGTKMNASKDGYDWYGVLSKDDRPIACDSEGNPISGNQLSRYWKIHVRTGDDGGLKFRTNSSKPNIAAFDNRKVVLDDYLYAFKALLNGKHELYRGSELISDKKFGFKGADVYYEQMKESPQSNQDNNFDRYVEGIKGGHDKDGDYLFFTTNGLLTQFEAMYGLGSSLYMPLCKDFIVEIGGEGNDKKSSEEFGMERYGRFVEENNTTPVDNILSLGQFTLEYWEEDKTIAFKKNDTWFESVADPTINRIPGYKYTVYKGATTDNTLVFKEFLAGKVDGARIPTTAYLKKYRNDPRTTQTTGDSVFKLNINSCSEERWEELFGEDGSIAQTQKSEYWNVKPWMSNNSFIRGINAAVDRNTFAGNRGMIPSNNYFSSNYMTGEFNPSVYNDSEAHKKAIADYFPESNGYNLSAAKTYFREAVQELVAAGKLELGSKKKPTMISFDIWWMYQSDIKDYGSEISKYIQDAFNSNYVCEGKVKLTINNFAVTKWSDVYYSHLMVGQFDLCFGSVSGNSLDPLNFMEVLRSDNVSGFTLNWGNCDTGVISEDLVFDGRCWSFNSLYTAADSYANLKEGNLDPLFDFKGCDSVTRLPNGALEVKFTAFETELQDGSKSVADKLCIYGATNESYSDYTEVYVNSDGSDSSDTENSSWTKNGNQTTVVFAPEIVDAMLAMLTAAEVDEFYVLGFDLYTLTELPSVFGDDYDSKLFGTIKIIESIPPIPAN